MSELRSAGVDGSPAPHEKGFCRPVVKEERAAGAARYVQCHETGVHIGDPGPDLVGKVSRADRLAMAEEA